MFRTKSKQSETMPVKTKLYGFQEDAIKGISRFNGRCLLSYSQGLGKSLVSISHIVNNDLYPALIVCPASLKYNWAAEFKKHADMDCVILSGKKPKRLVNRKAVYIINYDVLPSWVTFFKDLGLKIICIDESQCVRNMKALRTKACVELSAYSEHFLALTGTPVMNNPMDLYPVLYMIYKGKVCPQYKFRDRYCTYFTHHKYGVMITGAKNTKELNSFLTSSCMLRKRLEDCLPDMPPFSRDTVLWQLTPSQWSEYNQIEHSFSDWYSDNIRSNNRITDDMLAVKLGYMLRKVAEWKLPSLIEYIDCFLQNNAGKLLVFGLHTNIIRAIQARFNKTAVMIDGSVSDVNRQDAVYKFQNSPNTRLFVGQLIAAGTGLTLTAGNNTLFAELDFVPANHLQAERRNYRIGTVSHVGYTYAVMANTIEEYICKMLMEKQQIVDNVVDGIDTKGVSFSLLRSLRDSYLTQFLGAVKD